MELTQLRAFRTVAETQSFTRAAERLNLTQSAVSRQIGALEHELGEPLFVRGRRVVRLTGFGERTLSQVVRILDDLDGLVGQGSAASSAPTGQVHAAAATQAFVYLFAPLVPGVHARAPGHPAVVPHHALAPTRRSSTSSTAPSTSASPRGRWSRRRCT